MDAFDRLDAWLNRHHVPVILALLFVAYIAAHVLAAILKGA